MADRGSVIKNEYTQVDFSVEELRGEFEKSRAWEEEGDEIFKHHAMLNITYEELVANRPEAYKKLTIFFNVDYIEPKTSLKKQNPESLRLLVKNYDDLKAAFQDTEWAVFFEDYKCKNHL